MYICVRRCDAITHSSTRRCGSSARSLWFIIISRLLLEMSVCFHLFVHYSFRQRVLFSFSKRLFYYLFLGIRVDTVTNEPQETSDISVPIIRKMCQLFNICMIQRIKHSQEIYTRHIVMIAMGNAILNRKFYVFDRDLNVKRWKCSLHHRCVLFLMPVCFCIQFILWVAFNTRNRFRFYFTKFHWGICMCCAIFAGAVDGGGATPFSSNFISLWKSKKKMHFNSMVCESNSFSYFVCSFILPFILANKHFLFLFFFALHTFHIAYVYTIKHR